MSSPASAARSVLTVAGYGALALAVAVFLPDLGLGRWMALAAGMAILVAGAAVQEWRRRPRPAPPAGTAADLAGLHAAVAAELARGRDGLRADPAFRAGHALPVRRAAEPPDPDRPPDSAGAEDEGPPPLNPPPPNPPPPNPPPPNPVAGPESAGPQRAGLDMGELRQRLLGHMSGARADSRSPAGHPPGKGGKDSANAVLAQIRDALRDDRIDMALQPIVSLPQRKTRHYECFSRIRTAEGGVLLPGQYVELAERAGLIATLDNVLLLRCIQLIRNTVRRNLMVGFFVNLSGHTLRDAEFIAQLTDYLTENPDLAPRLAFEFDMANLPQMQGGLRGAIDRLAGLGARFSLDRLPTLTGLDIDALERSHIRFLKIDAAVLLDEVHGPAGGLRLDKVKQQLDRGAIDLIVSRIETEQTLIELLDLPVDFGQGLLFGEPRAG